MSFLLLLFSLSCLAQNLLSRCTVCCLLILLPIIWSIRSLQTAAQQQHDASEYTLVVIIGSEEEEEHGHPFLFCLCCIPLWNVTFHLFIIIIFFFFLLFFFLLFGFFLLFVFLLLFPAGCVRDAARVHPFSSFLPLFPSSSSSSVSSSSCCCCCAAGRSLDDLRRFRSFYLACVCYIYFSRLVVFMMQDFVPYDQIWISSAFTHTITLIFFVVTGLVYHPLSLSLSVCVVVVPLPLRASEWDKTSSSDQIWISSAFTHHHTHLLCGHLSFVSSSSLSPCVSRLSSCVLYYAVILCYGCCIPSRPNVRSSLFCPSFSWNHF